MAASSRGPSFVFAGQTIPVDHGLGTIGTEGPLQFSLDADAPQLWHRLQSRINDHLANGGWGMPVDHAYGGFVLKGLEESSGTLGNQPPQPALRDSAFNIDPDNPAIQLHRVIWRARFKPRETNMLKLETEDGPVGRMLYLFNVMVALEWNPNKRDLQQLAWAFRSASDFLYDVTDGYMAFGQVMVVGRDYLNDADIAIMASNRLQGRAWREGLHKPEKNLPIRLGRGNWRSRNSISVPWDEPEGYRTIIHEWGHYALNLVDAYLTQDYVAVNPSNQFTLLEVDLSAATGIAVMPALEKIGDSIMVTLEGTSELAFRPYDTNADTRKTEWAILSDSAIYPGLDEERPGNQGPVRLPLPLPLFVLDDEIEASWKLDSKPILVPVEYAKGIANRLGTPPERCWMYVLHADANGTVRRMIAQGTLDKRATLSDSTLLGAAEGDELVIIGERPRDGEPARMLAGPAGSSYDDSPLLDTPLVAVIPQPDSDPTRIRRRNRHLPHVVVRVYGVGDVLPTAWLFPFGGDRVPLTMTPMGSYLESNPVELETLDGHVLLEFPPEHGSARTIATFSQGGGPETSSPHEPPTPPPPGGAPITAGSSDGVVLLFFGDRPRGDEKSYEGVKVVTNALHGGASWRKPPGRQRSQIFCVAASAQLPPGFNPTLVIVYEPLEDLNERKAEVLTICRLDPQEMAWRALPTYVPSDVAAVVPLAYDTGSPLVSDGVNNDQRVEFFVVCSGVNPST